MADSATKIRLLTFSATTLNDYAGSDVDEILSKVDREEYAWVHVTGLHDLAVSTRILEHFGLPRSLAEQIETAIPIVFETGSERYLFKQFRFIARTTGAGQDARERAEHGFLIRRSETDRFEESGGTVILGKKFLLLFDDGEASHLIANARAEILAKSKRVQHGGVGHLLYWLIRIVVIDNYLSLFRQFMDEIQHAEDALLDGATDAAVYRNVVRLRKELNPFERSLLYAREFTGLLSQERSEVLSRASLDYLSESLVSDANRLEKEFSILRNRSSELIGMYRDNVNTQLNNIMRTLTVISAMFLPLTFITGYYGMNFPNMPAYRWSGSFPVVIAVMIALALGSLTFARKKKWL